MAFGNNVDSNPHLHLVAKMTKTEWRWLLNNGHDLWLDTQKCRQLDFSKIEYITKDFKGPDSQERLFVYKAPLDKPIPED